MDRSGAYMARHIAKNIVAQEEEQIDDRSMSYDCWELRKINGGMQIVRPELRKIKVKSKYPAGIQL